MRGLAGQMGVDIGARFGLACNTTDRKKSAQFSHRGKSEALELPSTTRSYYRALRNDGPFSEEPASAEDTQGYLYPDFEPRTYTLSNGQQRTRAAEVDTVRGLVQTGKGTSLLGDPEFFDQAHWHDFVIPTVARRGDTKIGRGRRQKTTPHFQIELVNPATRDAFRGALDTLARNAYAKAWEDARSGSDSASESSDETV